MQRILPVLIAVCTLAAAPARAADTPSTTVQRSAGDVSIGERIRRATVLVRTQMTALGPDAEMRGTGVIINSTGLVLSNNHVVDPNHGKTAAQRSAVEHTIGNLRYKVVTDIATPNAKVYDAKLIHQTEACDVSILQLMDKDGTFASTPYHLAFLPDEALHRGMKIKISGFPGGARKPEPPTVTEGLTTNLKRTTNGAISYIETDATVHPGNSGGPVVDLSGRVIGLATLEQFQEGQKNRSGVVPIHLIKTFLHGAFRESRVPKGIDLLPLLDLFLSEDDVLDLPEYPRDPALVTVSARDGTVRRGTLAPQKLNLNTPWGMIETPTDRMAYILFDGKTTTAVMDGGDRLTFKPAGMSLPVKFNNRSEQVKLTEINAIAFPHAKKPAPLFAGRGVVIEGQDCRMSFGEVKGDVSIDGARYALTDIAHIEVDEKGNRTVSTAKGERLRGKLADQPFTAVTTWLDKPISFRLSSITEASVSPIDWPFIHARGRRLNDRLEIQDPDLHKIADLLEGPNWKTATPLLQTAQARKDLTSVTRRQLNLLLGVERMRNKDFKGATAFFQKLPPREAETYAAQCYIKIFERYPDGTFGGQPLSEPDVLWRASTAEARRIMADVEDRRTKIMKLEAGQRVRALADAEKALDIADRLDIGCAQSALIQVLVAQFWAQVEQIKDINKDLTETVAEANSSTRRGTFTQAKQRAIALENRGKLIEKDLERIRDRIMTDAGGFKLDAPSFHENK